jgi:hypothetical protein
MLGVLPYGPVFEVSDTVLLRLRYGGEIGASRGPGKRQAEIGAGEENAYLRPCYFTDCRNRRGQRSGGHAKNSMIGQQWALLPFQSEAAVNVGSTNRD